MKMIIKYRCDGEWKSIDINKVDHKKHFPPREEGVSVPETPEYYNYLYNYVTRSLESECEAKLEPKRREEAKRQMIALEQKKKEQEKYETERRLWLKSLGPEAHLKRLVELISKENSREYTCPHCYNINKVKNDVFVRQALDIIQYIQKIKK